MTVTKHWACIMVLILGCAQPSLRPLTKPKYESPTQTKLPCWVQTPNCTATKEDAALYFTGQSSRPVPHWGHPAQESVQSALVDAEHQYARYLGVDIKSSTYLKQVFNDFFEREHLEQKVRTNVVQSVSAVKKIDQVSVAYQETRAGEPLWTVYVLIKVPEQIVKMHQTEIQAEIKRRKNAPPPPHQWTVEVFNIDDTAGVLVNDVEVLRCEFSSICRVKLTDHFKVGKNTVRIEFGNRFGFWTYGYEVKRDNQTMYEGRCGQVWVFGCDWDTSNGVVHSLNFEVEWTGSKKRL